MIDNKSNEHGMTKTIWLSIFPQYKVDFDTSLTSKKIERKRLLISKLKEVSIDRTEI
jgi:hypothetical protein